MTNELKQIMARAMKLSADERTVLAHRLFDSIETPIDPEIERKWAEECERRWQAYKEGKIQAIPGEKVMREARKRLNEIHPLSAERKLTQAEVEKIWSEECERRWQAYKKGKIRAIPAEDVFREAFEIFK